jgi:hypothetical protein
LLLTITFCRIIWPISNIEIFMANCMLSIATTNSIFYIPNIIIVKFALRLWSRTVDTFWETEKWPSKESRPLFFLLQMSFEYFEAKDFWTFGPCFQVPTQSWVLNLDLWKCYLADNFLQVFKIKFTEGPTFFFHFDTMLLFSYNRLRSELELQLSMAKFLLILFFAHYIGVVHSWSYGLE